MNQTKALVFDLGAVIINIDFRLAFEAFHRISGIAVEAIATEIKDNGLLADFEAGRLDEAGFFKQLAETMHYSGSVNALIDAWNALLIDIPKHRVERIIALRKQYPVYLLSNTNSTHIKAVESILLRDTGVERLGDLFDTVFLSYEIGLLKPEAAIYKHVTEAVRTDPNSLLFLDDNTANIHSAQAFGWQAIQVHPDKDMCHYLENV
jgi:epoxide hydrolase-like predicted phosphatase